MGDTDNLTPDLEFKKDNIDNLLEEAKVYNTTKEGASIYESP